MSSAMKKLSKTEKKIRMRTAKRVKRAVQSQIPTSGLGEALNKVVLFVEKIWRKK